MCDRRTVRSQDIVEVDQVAPTKLELSMSLKHQEGQKYYWLPKQTPEEVTIFTSWDSEQGNVIASQELQNLRHETPFLIVDTDHTPHGAYMNAPLDEAMEPRESVEVRLIVLWPAA